MQKLLKDLYYGKVQPLSEPLENIEDYQKNGNILIQHEEELKATLSESQKKLYEKVSEKQSELNAISSEQKFIQGFKLGAKLAIEIMNDDKITE